MHLGALAAWPTVARFPILLAAAIVLISLSHLGVARAAAQQVQRTAPAEADLADRLISEVRIRGLRRVDEQLVRNNIRTSAGDPFAGDVVRADVARLERLGQFRSITPIAEILSDGTVAVTYTFVEQPLITEVQVIGNSLVSDQDLRDAIGIPRGAPLDEFRIDSAKRAIQSAYRSRGHFLAEVFVDQSELEESGLLLFRIVEGPRLRIRAVEFVGNDAFEDEALLSEIETRPAMFLLRLGELDEDTLRDDVAALDTFYRDRGYLDVRVDRRIEISPDQREAKVVFLIVEGPRYTLRSVRTERRDGQPLRVFSPEQIAALIEIQPGDTYSGDRLRRSVEIVRDAYSRLGRIGAGVVSTEPYRIDPTAQVDLVLVIDEGRRATVGLVEIQGNFLTRDNVIRRQIRLRPGRPLDATEIDRSTRRIRDTRLFNDVRITVQDPHPDQPDVHDVLVEVEERNTGAVNFGAAFGTDTGVFGELSISQTNFDLFDTPDSLGEFFSGRSFRGAGQTFNMTFRPGNELFQYMVSLTEPHLLESDLSLTVGGSFYQRLYRQYEEERITGDFSLGRELGDVWRVSLRGRGERVKLFDIDDDAPVDVFDAAGPDVITSLGVALTRNTYSTIVRPGSGSRFQITFDRIGALGGDFAFNRIGAEHNFVVTVDEDFLGRRSTLRFTTEVGYIFGGDDPPVYERFYRGGQTFRGFRFREVSPKGIRNDTGERGDDPVGGEWMFFLGSQYEFPLFGESITGVVFVDTGTVTDSPGFDDYRVSVGGGVRLYIPALGPVPIAVDLGFPIVKEPDDRRQLISFTFELPF